MNVEVNASQQEYNINKGRMQKVFLVLFVGVLSFFIVSRTMKTPTITNDLFLENVEALANVENSVPTHCWGEGNFTCPVYGAKVEYVYIGYSLEPDEETY